MIFKFKKSNLISLLKVTVLYLLFGCLYLYFANKQIMMGIPDIASPFRLTLSISTRVAFGVVLILASSIGFQNKTQFLKKLSVTYISYITIRYLIVITRNLNNTEFHYEHILKNDFFQIQGLITIILILAITFCIDLLKERFHLQNKFWETKQNSVGDDFIIAFLITILLFNTKDFLLLSSGQIPDLSQNSNLNEYLNQVVILITEWTLFLSTTILVFLKSVKDLGKRQTNFALSLITSFFLAVLCNYGFQYGVKSDSSLLGQFVFPGGTSFQILILTIVFLLVYLIINRYLISTLFLLVIGVALSVANLLKGEMRSEPLLVSDFLWLGEIGTVLSFVDKKMIAYISILVLLPVILYFGLRRTFMTSPMIKQKRMRLLIISLLVLTLSQIFVVFSNEKDGKINNKIPIISKVNNWYDIEWMGPSVNARYKSLVYVWTKQLTKTTIVKPAGYGKEKVDNIVKKYTEEAKQINSQRTNTIENETVIYILSESLSDPSRLTKVHTSKDVLSNIRQIKRNTTSGIMISDGFGGGTANMEFQTLTGLPFYNYSPSVSTLYTEVVPKMKLFPSISNSFEPKNRVVIHPSGANNYSRKTIYNDLDFNKLIFSVDSNDTFKNPRYKGVSISDETVYDTILEELKSKESQFFSVITMQNHVPWSIGEPSDISGTGDDFSKEQNGELSEYLRLLYYTDVYTKNFLESLSHIEKNVTVVFYGDHLPGFYPDSVFEDDMELKYQTDYFIWSNHNNRKLDYPVVNSSDFIAVLLEQTNSKVTPYQALLTSVLKEASVDKTDLSSKGKEVAKDLKIIQYDISLGKNYSGQTNFFNKLKGNS